MKEKLTSQIFIVGIILLFSASAVYPAAFGSLKKEEAFGSVEVKVIFADTGKEAKNAFVSVGGKEYRTDEKGKVLAENVPVGDAIVTAEKVVKKGGFLGLFSKKVRYIGFQEAFVEEGKTSAVEVKIESGVDVNARCMSCHPQKPTRERRIIKCLHKSGDVLEDKMVERVKAYNEKIEKLEKEGKPHSLPMRLEKRKINDKTVYVYTCESCHTLHVKTPYRRYAIAPFFEKSDLCLACHY